MRMLRTQIKWIMLSVAIIFVLSLLFMYGPVGGGREDGSTRDYAVATVNGKKIMRSALEERLQEAAGRQEGGSITSEDLPRLRKSVLEGMVLVMELEKEVKARGIKVEEGDIDEVLQQIKEQFPTIEAFNQHVKRMGVEMKELRQNISLQLAQQKVLDGELGSVMLAEGEVQAFYDEAKDAFFRRPEGFNLNIAHVKEGEGAAKIAELLREGGDWDGELAAHSTDVIDHTPYEEPFFVAAEALQGPFAVVLSADVDGLVGPIEAASDDFVLVVKREALPDQILPLEEVSGDIENLLLSQRRSEAQQKFFKGLLERAQIALHDEALFALPESAQEPLPVPASEEAALSPDEQPLSEAEAPAEAVSPDEPDKTE